MKTDLPTLIIPVELQVREFDAKLLMSCVAAESGFPVILGSQTQIHLRIASLPRGIYVAKDIRFSKSRMIAIMKQLGFEIVAWDEEGLVRYPPVKYFEARIGPENFAKIAMFFAWGPDDAEVIASHPDAAGLLIHRTGNPRIDMLHPDLRFLYDSEVRRIKDKYGRFILINTNFGTSNHFLEKYRIPTPAADEGVGNWDEDMARYRNALYAHFLQMIPELGRAFEDTAIILRPHPSESLKSWQQAAAGCKNIHVTNEGSAIPWQMASDVLVHNGCTTAIESYLLDKPAVAYQPISSQRFDRHLPNSISYKARTMEELTAQIRPFVNDELKEAHTREQDKYFDRHVVRRAEDLASDRVVAILRQSAIVRQGLTTPGPVSYLLGLLKAKIRTAEKTVNAYIPGSKNSFSYERTRFPGISELEVQTKIRILQEHLGRFENVIARPLTKDIFQIEPR